MSHLKQILAWIRQNIAIVISSIVILAAAPTGLILGLSKAGEIREQAEDDIDQRMRRISSAPFNYQVPPLLSTQPGASFRRPPNEATNEAIASYMVQAAEAAEQTYQAVLEWNSRDRDLLVEGLFPAPAPSEYAGKLQEVIREWPAAQARALEEAGVGAPPDPAMVRARIETERDQWLRRAAERGEDAAEAVNDPALRERLTQRRLNMYEEQARDIAFYAPDNVLAGVQPWAGTDLPTLDVAWDWQHRTWMHQDLLEALALANTDSAGVPQSVLDGAVKRIERISVGSWTYGDPRQAQPISPLTPIPLNYEVSFTGLGAPNPLYDARYATVVIVVDGVRLPDILDAFNAAGLMTVIDVRLEPYDAADDLAQGYMYGGGALVRATLRVETLWLREWMQPLMPEKVRQALGVPAPQPAQGSTTEQPGSPAGALR